jgi:uncharacterized repeat protein (TIGR03806 family)
MKLLLVGLFFISLAGCAPKEDKAVVVREEKSPIMDLSGLGPPKLTDYGFFKNPISKLVPTDSLEPYELNAALFSDYAYKKRFIKIPKGKTANYRPAETLDLPEGTILVKNFFYPADFSKPENDWRILETRLLINDRGRWKPLNYIWNDEQTEAYLDVAGRSVSVNWVHHNGEKRSITYSIPSINQCKSCHMRGGEVQPIGPSARQLNRMTADGKSNQLIHLNAIGKLTGLPEPANVPRLASYDDVNESVNDRARAWLEINCAHCHRPEGPAKTSGLHLLVSVQNKMEIGIGKAPVAAGKGTGGLLYDIVPGKPDQSILHFRIASTDPGVMMPELGRSVVHQEGVNLIRQWILEMK